MTFEQYITNLDTIINSFPNKDVWARGDIGRNRQVARPEAGYCIAFRYDDTVTDQLSTFSSKIWAMLPPVVKYNAGTFHTTIGVHGKSDMASFIPAKSMLTGLETAIGTAIHQTQSVPQVDLGRWLYNEEAILVSGRPSRAFWALMQTINQTCADAGYPLSMSRMTHVTTTRFLHRVDRATFEQFAQMMQTAPKIGLVVPRAVELTTWRCDGWSFELTTHAQFPLI